MISLRRRNSLVSFNQWIVLYYGIALSFVLLIAIPEENFVVCSIPITLR